MPATPPPIAKDWVRSHAKTALKQTQNTPYHQIATKIINLVLCSWVNRNNIQCVLGYFALPWEIDLTPFYRFCKLNGIILAFPIVFNENMKYYTVSSIDDTKPHPHFKALREPIDQSQPWDGDNLPHTIILAPAIAFDQRGYRVGFGKGYFDRFLQTHRLQSVGIGLFCQIFPHIAKDTWDIPLNTLITERGVSFCGS